MYPIINDITELPSTDTAGENPLLLLLVDPKAWNHLNTVTFSQFHRAGNHGYSVRTQLASIPKSLPTLQLLNCYNYPHEKKLSMHASNSLVHSPKTSSMKAYLSFCLRPEVSKTALKLSLLVGTLLALINHGPTILNGTLNKQNLFQIFLSYMVPYCVSTYSSVKMIRSKMIERE